MDKEFPHSAQRKEVSLTIVTVQATTFNVVRNAVFRPILPLTAAMPARRTDRRRSRPRPLPSWLSTAPSRPRRQPPRRPPSPRPPIRIRLRLSKPAPSDPQQIATPTPPRQSSSTPTPTPSGPAEPSLWNEQERALIRAGYHPAYDPPEAPPAPESSTATGSARKKKTVRFDMAEPRARAARQKGQLNFGPESMPYTDSITTRTTN